MAWRATSTARGRRPSRGGSASRSPRAASTVFDDGSVEGRRGSLTVDDEGTPTSRTILIEDGILVGYMQDRQSARLLGMPTTGNGRRQSYAHIPMPRMTNTGMLAGDSNREAMIASTKRGLYCANFGGGQVDITNGKFVFQCTEAYLIEDGKDHRAGQGRHPDRRRTVGPDTGDHGRRRLLVRPRHRCLRQGGPGRAGRGGATVPEDHGPYGRRHGCLKPRPGCDPPATTNWTPSPTWSTPAIAARVAGPTSRNSCEARALCRTVFATTGWSTQTPSFSFSSAIRPARSNRRRASFAWSHLARESGELSTLAIRPDLQDLGLGRSVLDVAESHIAASGGHCIQITVLNNRAPLIAWYERRGYRATGEVKTFPYHGSPFGTPLRDDLAFTVLRKPASKAR